MKYNLTLYKQISRIATFSLTYLLIFLIVLTIYAGGVTAPWYLIGIPFFLIVMALYERYCFNLFVYIILHALLLIPVFLIPVPSPYYRYLYLTLIVFETLRNIHVWTIGGVPPYKDIPLLLFAFILLTYTISNASHQALLTKASYYIGLGIVSLHFVRYFITGLEKLLSKPGNTTSLPTKKIMLTNSSLFGIFLLVFVLICLFFHLFELDFLVQDLGDFLLRILRFLVHAVMYIVAVLRALTARNTKTPPEEPIEQEENFYESFQEMVEPSLLAEITTGIVKVLVFAFLLYILYRILSDFIKTYMNRYVEDADVVLTLDTKEERISIKTSSVSVKETIKAFFDQSPSAQIRRAYRTKIRQYKRLKHKKSDTSAELENQIATLYNEDICDLTGIYQKARYSNEKITANDLATASIQKVENPDNT
ncbi:MAG: hypothetical protein K2L07_08100 [Lachnospiraceae bacterium]|nr:hypothetical protein [Lachnospiraceae bacterium]